MWKPQTNENTLYENKREQSASVFWIKNLTYGEKRCVIVSYDDWTVFTNNNLILSYLFAQY
jgi:hypothetical protein